MRGILSLRLVIVSQLGMSAQLGQIVDDVIRMTRICGGCAVVQRLIIRVMMQLLMCSESIVLERVMRDTVLRRRDSGGREAARGSRMSES